MNHENPLQYYALITPAVQFSSPTFAAEPRAFGFRTGHLVNERAYYRLSEIPFGEVKSEEEEFYASLAADLDIAYPTCTTWRFFLPF